MTTTAVEEQYDILDENGNKTGEVLSKSVAHDRELLHGAVQIWVYNTKGEILLQRRSKSKKIFPGAWDISAAGHISAGETPVVAAIREVEEEIGIKVNPEELRRVAIVRDTVPLLPNKTHPEMAWVYILHKELDPKKLTIQQSELTAVKLMPIQEVQAQLRNSNSDEVYAHRNSKIYDIAFGEIEKILDGREISFLDRPFYIDKTVHRPRTSTEFITEHGYIGYINQIGRTVTAADIGVGSGVTAISCALDCPNLSTIYGVDLYNEALAIAARNAATLHAGNKLELLQGDLFAPLLDKPVDVIIANLPFANTAKVAAITEETPTLDEPITGIHGGDTGFELYEKMFDQLKNYEYMDRVLGLWVFCGTEHTKYVAQRHKAQFSDFTLMAFQDKYKPHFSHFLLTRTTFNPGPELIPSQRYNAQK
jgi:isopentenyl-diphosphate Delta-isomerase